MNFFDVLSLIGGLSLFLFGMNFMGQALERRAGDSLSSLVGKLTTNRFTGFLTGLMVTAIIQSSSATTVMAVGFVNSGIMSLKQSINVIMGANVGTTVTSWILSLGGIDSGNFFLKLLKPTSFTPILALIGIIYYMFLKSSKKKDTGLILLGFATLMFGMDAMSGAVAGLADVPAFRELFIMFKNPILGVLAGAVLTAVIQSSSASVGILQALTVTGQVSYGAAFPIIMGQNIGTCITAILSSFGANRNAKRVAVVHLLFNAIGTVIMLVILYAVKGLFAPALLNESATHFGIAVSHSIFNVVCTIILFPMGNLLHKLVCKLVPDAKSKEEITELDERLLATPSVAIDHCRNYTVNMAKCAISALKDSLYLLKEYKPAVAEEIREREEKSDHYEDIIGNYLVKLSTRHIEGQVSVEAASLLRMIGDFERISDHAVNILESVEELKDKEIIFTDDAKKELELISSAVSETLDFALEAFIHGNLQSAFEIEPLEQIIDRLKEKLRANHITRLQQGECTIDAGFIWSDLLTDLERVADHCSNIAGCLLETSHNNLNMHEGLRAIKSDNPEYRKKYELLLYKYSLAE